MVADDQHTATHINLLAQQCVDLGNEAAHVLDQGAGEHEDVANLHYKIKTLIVQSSVVCICVVIVVAYSLCIISQPSQCWHTPSCRCPHDPLQPVDFLLIVQGLLHQGLVRIFALLEAIDDFLCIIQQQGLIHNSTNQTLTYGSGCLFHTMSPPIPFPSGATASPWTSLCRPCCSHRAPANNTKVSAHTHTHVHRTCMCVCTYVYIYIYTHTQDYVFVYTYMHMLI